MDFAAGIKTGNPVLDVVLNAGSYGLVFGIAYLLVKFLYEAREKDRIAAEVKREQDWKDLKASWEKEREELYRFRDLSRAEWDKERAEMISQRDLAQREAAESRRTANEALSSVRSFLENGQKETLATLRDSSSALKEAALKERSLEERLAAQQREIEMMRGLLTAREPRALPGSGSGGLS